MSHVGTICQGELGFFNELSDRMGIQLEPAMWREVVMERPIIVCLCGSTRFGEQFADANLKETLSGKIVLSIGCNMKCDDEIFGQLSTDELNRIKTDLDNLHMRKIELADEVLILNVDGYVGESTSNELAHARKLGKRIRFLEN